MSERFPIVPDLAGCLHELLGQVPAGRVATCGDLAEGLGNRIAARWIGHYALHHDHRPGCLCHRIVRMGGELGGYAAGSIGDKVRRLAEEGVVVRRGRLDLEHFAFRDFVSDRPLEQLRQLQKAIQRRIVLRPRRRMPKLVGGIDVAYPRPDLGVAAFALVETASGRLVWCTSICRPVAFPYISSYLSFREIPILLDLLDEVRAAGRGPEVLLVDGTGILHPRRAGIASHLGVAASLPTIGVTKKLLCGQVDIKNMSPGETRPVVYEGDLIGTAVRPTAGSQRPIFISPGHRVDLAFCERLTCRLLTGRRLPEPVYWADRISKEASRSYTRKAGVILSTAKDLTLTCEPRDPQRSEGSLPRS